MVDRVVVVPLSGYVNRMQAIASASLMAQDLGAELSIIWETTEVAPAPAAAVFGSSLLRHVQQPDTFRVNLGMDLGDVPLHFRIDRGRGLATLRGHLKGEQYFMPEVLQAIREGSVRELLIVAGGKFALVDERVLSAHSSAMFRERRRAFYAGLRLHDDVEQAVSQRVSSKEPFMGLHLRYSDRDHQAPMQRSIGHALQKVRERSGLTRLFIASDVPSQRDSWSSRARAMGFETWSEAPAAFPRSDPRSAHAALIDWRLLAASRAAVYFAESSFAEEAIVASGNFDDCVALPPSAVRSIAVRGRRLAQSAVTYPQRRRGASGTAGPTAS